jgi:hypothetical protein
MTVYLAPLVTILGCLVYALSSNGKVAELGRLAYAAGLLVTLLQFMAHVTHLP